LIKYTAVSGVAFLVFVTVISLVIHFVIARVLFTEGKTQSPKPKGVRGVGGVRTGRYMRTGSGWEKIEEELEVEGRSGREEERAEAEVHEECSASALLLPSKDEMEKEGNAQKKKEETPHGNQETEKEGEEVQENESSSDHPSSPISSKGHSDGHSSSPISSSSSLLGGRQDNTVISSSAASADTATADPAPPTLPDTLTAPPPTPVSPNPPPSST
jgi:hypothetical protein